MTMVTFLLGYALGQPLYGPITDRFGRKPPLYASLLVFIAASAACALSPSIPIMSLLPAGAGRRRLRRSGDVARHGERSFSGANCAAFFRCWCWCWACRR
jgi:MFS family permease